MKPAEYQHLRRPHGIGGSDVAALLGLSPFKSPVQLWAEKTGHPSVVAAQGMHLRLGQHLEPFVAAEYERATGLVAQVHQEPIFHKEHPFLFAHVDRLVQSDPNSNHWVDGITQADTVLECKTASAFNKDEWGEALADQVPTHYMLQCAWYMALTQCTKADVAVLIGNQDFRIFRIHRNFDLERALLVNAQRFWEECVLKGVPPTPKSPSDASIIYPSSKEGVRIEASAEVARSVERLKGLQQQMKELDQEMEHLKSLVMSYLGESEELAVGERVLATWKSTKPVKRLDTQALKAAHPDIAKAFSVEGAPSRRFVVKESA
jgi:putative phage-type endonuclease